MTWLMNNELAVPLKCTTYLYTLIDHEKKKIKEGKSLGYFFKEKQHSSKKEKASRIWRSRNGHLLELRRTGHTMQTPTIAVTRRTKTTILSWWKVGHHHRSATTICSVPSESTTCWKREGLSEQPS